MGHPQSTRGILRPRAGFEHFELDRAPAPEDLRAIVSGLWTVCWNLPEGETFEQEILPYPNVNLAFEWGKWNVHGPTRERFVARLSGSGWVAGMRFRPAGFFALSARPMEEIVERLWSAPEALGCEPVDFPVDKDQARGVLVEQVRACLRRKLAASSPVDLDELARVSEWVERAETDRSISTASDLAKVANLSVRSLHRTLEKYVGVSSKWIVRRARIQECADRVARGQVVRWASVAHDLGYHDQAHLIHDFKTQMGLTPAAYAEQCAKDIRGSK